MNRPILLVAGREIRQRLRSKMFIIVTLLLAAVLAIAAGIPGAMDRLFGAAPPESASDEAAVETTEVALVGDLSEARRAAIERSVPGEVLFIDVPDKQAATDALAGGASFAVTEGGARLLAPPSDGPFDSPVSGSVTEALGLAAAIEDAGGDAAQVAVALEAAPVEVEVVDLGGGGVDPATAGGRFAVAYAGSFMLYLVLVLFASLVANGVVEEKTSRVVELLLPALPARLLMMGKLLGIGVVGTVQVTVIVAPALIVMAVRNPGLLPPGVGPAVVSVIVFFALGFALYAGITAGLSALASRVEDVQTVVMPVYAVLVVAFMLSFPTLTAPETTLATVATFVPFSAPFVVPVRMALVELPLWQAALAGLGVAVTAYLLTLLAARLYENSILRGGGRVKLTAAWRGER